jgi:hypothetical protein
MSFEKSHPPVRWHRTVLQLAGLYNIAWGAFAVLFPEALFRWCDVRPMPNHPELWQCIGMIVGVYGIGYAIAATDSRRHWPIVLVGLLGKIFGPIGFVQAVVNEQLPITMGITILFNDLVWWVPFGLILADAYRAASVPARPAVEEVPPEIIPGPQRRTTTNGIVWSSVQSAPTAARRQS